MLRKLRLKLGGVMNRGHVLSDFRNRKYRIDPKRYFFLGRMDDRELEVKLIVFKVHLDSPGSEISIITLYGRVICAHS